MSDASVLGIACLEMMGLIGLWHWLKFQAKRRAEGKERFPRPVRIFVALLGLAIMLGFPAVMITSIVNPIIRSDRQHDKLVRTGSPATAVITNIEETGTFYNQRPEVRMSLSVQPQNAPAFHSQETRTFSVRDVQTYRVGTNVRVFFNPKNHDTVAVVGVAPSSK